MNRPKASTKVNKVVTPSLAFASQSAQGRVDDPGMDELSRKMLSWGRLWFGASRDGAPTEKHDLVRERLLSWLELCIGHQARTVVTRRAEEVSLATSTPLLTAFLGRRAMLKLSRRVLNDL